MRESKLASLFLVPCLAVCVFYWYSVWSSKIIEYKSAEHTIRIHRCDLFQRYQELKDIMTEEQAIVLLGDDDWSILIQSHILQNKNLQHLCNNSLESCLSPPWIQSVKVLLYPHSMDQAVYLVFICFVLVTSMFFAVFKPFGLLVSRIIQQWCGKWKNPKRHHSVSVFSTFPLTIASVSTSTSTSSSTAATKTMFPGVDAHKNNIECVELAPATQPVVFVLTSKPPFL